MKSASWIHGQPLQVALRTYALSLSLSLGPSLIPFVTAFLTAKPSPRTGLKYLRRILRREIGLDGFASAMTLAVGGGALIRELWRILDDAPQERQNSFRNHMKARVAGLNLTPAQKTFISNIISSSFGILLLQAGRQRSYRLRRDLTSPSVSIPLTPPTPSVTSAQTNRPSDTLDLTLLLLVRAADALLQILIRKATDKFPSGAEDRRDSSHVNAGLMGETLVKDESRQEKAKLLTSRIDAFVFWACSARIMWCFFYEPQRLPRSYVKWIATLANLDTRVVQALRLLRDGGWSYIKGSRLHSDLLTGFSTELGHSASLGDPVALPGLWRSCGGCLHGAVGSSLGLQGSCTANSSIRAIAIYLPAHFLPILLTRPQTLLMPHRTIATLFGAIRSATFLSAFVTLYWSAVCITRSLVFARLLPNISHDFWDGPFGCIFAGCLLCGSSIWIENGHRRGEMALYVLPRAVRACLPDTWVRNTSKRARVVERIAFVLSFSALITTARHHPETLRGLSRWTLSFITNGPNAGFWKRRRRNPSAPDTPITPPTPKTTNQADLSTDPTINTSS
ncbi:hypothetical protein FPV67DRAFT_1557883 [Lyophyllum atratum]|nr:hypothetical protein FPV67DRAFT_1557883 [Lyophyllum atratum]